MPVRRNVIVKEDNPLNMLKSAFDTSVPILSDEGIEAQVFLNLQTAR
jgi:hypothetical protein